MEGEGDADAGPGGFTLNSTYSDAAMDLDFMDELLFEGCWLETNDDFNEFNMVPFNVNSLQMHQGETETPVSPRCYMKNEDLSAYQSPNGTAGGSSSLSQPRSFIVQGIELGSRWWIGPRAESGTVKERLMQAIGFLKESTKDRDVLIQIWVPVKREGKHVL